MKTCWPRFIIDSDKLIEGLSLDDIDREVDRIASLPVVRSGLDMLVEIPLYLHFHNAEHTWSVFWAVVALMLIDELPKEDRELTAIAAAYHDLGFLSAQSGAMEAPYENEQRGAEIAVAAMTGLYPQPSIAVVREMILDTALVPRNDAEVARQQPQIKTYSAYLLDADLHNLGTESFIPNILRLYNERFSEAIDSVDALKKIPEGKDFMRETLGFVLGHTWKTETAEALFQKKKEQNILLLESLLK